MHAPGAVTESTAVFTPTRFISSLDAIGFQLGVGQPLGSPPCCSTAVVGLAERVHRLRPRATVTLCIEWWNEMMVSIDLVHWRRVTPSHGFVPEPVENVLTHDATEARLEQK